MPNDSAIRETSVILLVPGRVGHVAGRQVRLPDEPDDQVGGERQNQPDQEEPQAVAGE